MIIVLRLNHRQSRDKRVTTHCGLVARAFGADSFVLSGENDPNLLKGLERTVRQWGGAFSVSFEPKWRKLLEEKKKAGFKVVHLSMFGHKIQDKISGLRGVKDLILVVGSSKVPADLYEMADYNIAIGNQPHSEVAALAVFLHEYFHGAELGKDFIGAKTRIVPGSKG
ncbi:MAG TPA: tRNA (cytidine(56)-2'-O)-methyltransferase [archaeon]|nr:tRNA (cytidine(56)-2'-O)-methyltransferase [archaeon]HLD81142.1 tRNA (cytidine(56)-2'-O)-methyltransferase [archaeon]